MANTLPTLKGLRAFEEAYVTGSYTEAAKRLNVQQPAISYQIKRLEEDLGIALFIKESGRLVATPAANELYDTISKSFDAIRKTSDKLRAVAAESTFTIATYAGIGTYWLASKLPELTLRLGVAVKIVTLVKDADLLREHADCLILFGRGQWAGFDARLLMPEQVCPVTAPDLAERVLSAHSDPNAAPLTIIEQEDPETRWIGWEEWQSQTGDQTFAGSNRLAVNDHGLALHMAMTGAGATLAWLGVVEDLLSSGSLVTLSDKIATSDAGYWMLGRPGFFDTDPGQTLASVLTGDR